MGAFHTRPTGRDQNTALPVILGASHFGLKKIVTSDIHENFLLFSAAMRFLTIDQQEDQMEFVKNLLLRFIEGAVKIYGLGFLSYDVHSLQHLVDDYSMYGDLDKVSVFKFESYLGSQIKGAVRSGHKPLRQIASHISLINNNPNITCKTEVLLKCERKPLASSEKSVGESYKSLRIRKNLVIKRGSLGCRDNVVRLKNDKVAIVRDIVLNTVAEKVVVQIFKNVKPFFE
jgi:hypothetical protein